MFFGTRHLEDAWFAYRYGSADLDGVDLDKWDEKFLAAMEWVHDKILGPVNEFQDKRGRTVYVKIDDYDMWNLDNTLSMIIVPALKLLKEKKHGAPYVDDEDVPERLRSYNSTAAKEDYGLDDNFFNRWDWVLDEIIWSFEFDQTDLLSPDKQDLDRQANGRQLFAKYYTALWD
jgi:hypothetical protein